MHSLITQKHRAEANTMFRTILIITLMFSGVIKPFIATGLDITILLYILTIATLFLTKTTIRRSDVSEGLWFIPFFIFYIFSNIYTLSESYSVTASLKYSLAIFSLFIPMLLIRKYDDFLTFKSLYKLVYVGAVIFLLVYFFVFDQLTVYLQLEKGYGIDYLAISSILLSSVLMFINDESHMLKIIHFASLIIVIALGARGPIFIFILLILIYGVMNVNIKFFKSKNFLYLIVFTVLMFLYGDSLYDRLFNRFSAISGDKIYENSRYGMWVAAINGIQESPLIGHGIGSYGLYFIGEDVRAYPHNIILQVFFETGMVGLILWSLFIIKFIHFLGRNCKDSGLIMLAAFLLLETLKSNSLVDSRILFLWLGLIIVATNTNLKRSLSTNN